MSERTVSILGFGLMGAQIAQLFPQREFKVRAYDVDPSRLESGIDLVRKGPRGLESASRKGLIAPEEEKRILERIKVTDSLKDVLSGAEFIVETAVEKLETKQELVRAVFEFSSAGSLVVSNTSTLSIEKIGEDLSEKDSARFAGMHFFNPPQAMKLVEVVRSRKTSEATISKILYIAKELRKPAVIVRDYPGFVANRIGISVFAEASRLLENNVASIREIDLAMRLGYGYPIGPFELGDLVGLDSRLRNMEALYDETGDEKFRPPEILRKLVAEGFLGNPKSKQGSKGGYYEYFHLKRPSDDTKE
jgi:3-hydroxybutyryl-CoA dehydrogenase